MVAFCRVAINSHARNIEALRNSSYCHFRESMKNLGAAIE